MQDETGELAHEDFLSEFFGSAEFLLEFLDGEAVEVGHEKGCVVLFQKIAMLVRIVDYIFNCFASANLSLGVSIHSIIENNI